MKIKRIFINILLLTIAGLSSLTMCAEEPQRPALLLTITIEGLSDNYLRLLSTHFTPGGFNRVAANSLAISDLRYGPDIDATAAAAIFYTGAAPTINGIGALKVYNKELRAPFHIFHDPSKVGNFTTETYSPAALLCSTLADEVRIDARGAGVVHSIALTPDQAIIGAGHAANGAFWISDKNGNWASSTYYFDMPTAVSNLNYKRPLSARLDTMKWEPLLNPMLFPALSEQKKTKPFKHTFAKTDTDRYAAFRSGALGNTEVTNLAIDFIESMSLGRHNATDMLAINYTVAPYKFGKSSDSSLEIVDDYLRLDRDLQRLIKAAEAKAAPRQVAVVIAGIPTEANDKRDDKQFNIPYGQFSVKKATSLLNVYLMALHGNGAWVDGYYQGHFFLNTTLAKDRNIDIAALRAETADFLSRMSGVAEVFTIDDILASRAGDEPEALKRNTIVKHSGDVIIRVSPGWEIVDDGTVHPSVVRRVAQQSIPAFIMAPGVKARTIATPIDARRLAPTVAQAIWLRAPNGASQPPISTH